MFFLFGLLTGLVIGGVFHFCRTREMRRAIKAALAQNEAFSDRLTRADKTLADLHAMAARMRRFNLDLGGEAGSGASAEHFGQHFVRETAPLKGAVETTGPSQWNDGPGFSRRAQ